MTEVQSGRSSASNEEPPSALAQLAELASPKRPAGSAGLLLNRLLVYARPDQVPSLLPHVDAERGGFVLAGAKAFRRLQLLSEGGFTGPVVIDPAKYEKHTASIDAPFWLPEDELNPTTLEHLLDQQLAAGASIAFTPSKYFSAGDTSSLRAATAQIKQLRRNDVVFVAPLDISLLTDKFIRQTTAILVDLGCPVALVLGKQLDPLKQAAPRIIRNLRMLAALVELMPIRTDLNALDLVAHGAFAGAIGTGGRIRHTVDPTEKPFAVIADTSPSVFIPELMCWWKGSKIAELFGARPNLVPRCPCEVCDDRKLNRFLSKSEETEARKHAVAVWSTYAAKMFAAPTMRARAQFWQNVCLGALHHHELIAAQLKLLKPLKPQKPLEVWANSPLWLSDQP
jgi:hypothetical protein